VQNPSVASLHTPSGLPRARAIGIPFDGTPGPLNAITDVPGVEVGYVTLIEGESVRTGVSAVLPLGRDRIGATCPAGWWSLNGNGEMTGTTWITETGGLSGPVLVTNTHAVGTVHRGVIDWVRDSRPEEATAWLLPVVAETWDGYLNDINANTVRAEHAGAAIDAARGGPIEEGSVGGGTGMNCYGFKGGNGTASRLVSYAGTTHAVAAFVQANFGGRAELRLAGLALGDLGVPHPLGDLSWFLDAGSVIVLVATDAPLLPAQCTALARRVPLGLARTGTTGSHFSGDIFLAWSTAGAGALDSGFPLGEDDERYETLTFVSWGQMDRFYAATVQCVEEAVANALVANQDMTGRAGHWTPALPHHLVRDRLIAAGLVD
jgi:D-aminopeptidase